MEYVSYCGLLCNECPVYIATAQNDNLMKAKLAKEYSSESSQFSAGYILLWMLFRDK